MHFGDPVSGAGGKGKGSSSMAAKHDLNYRQGMRIICIGHWRRGVYRDHLSVRIELCSWSSPKTPSYLMHARPNRPTTPCLWRGINAIIKDHISSEAGGTGGGQSRALQSHNTQEDCQWSEGGGLKDIYKNNLRKLDPSFINWT